MSKKPEACERTARMVMEPQGEHASQRRIADHSHKQIDQLPSWNFRS